jgi:Mrp family chromosome partitioning ATPase/capsular polysaccharide biosynthesis protein
MNSIRPLDALRRFWWIVVIFTILGAVVAGAPSPQKAADSVTRWNAAHTLLVTSSSESGGVYSDPQAFNQLTLFATTGKVPERAAETLDYQGSPAALASQVVVTSDSQTGALQISTTQETEDDAVAIADTFAIELSTYLAERQDQLSQDRIAATLTRLDDLEAQINEIEATVLIPSDDPDGEPAEDPVARAQLDALSRQYSVVFEQYNTLNAEQGQLVLTTLEEAQGVPIEERGLSAPRSRVSRGVLGALVGAAIGFGIALLLARADRRIRTTDQLTEILGVEVNTAIPAVRHHKTDQLAVRPGQYGPLSDSYRTLRSMIAFLDAGRDHDGRAAVTLVVSPGSGDGKTSVTANLAAAFVESGAKTVAVNTDFRRPTLSTRLGVADPEPSGLDLRAIQSAPLELILAPGENPGLAVLDLSGMRGVAPGDLARVTASLIPRIADAADAVVIDTSPVGATAEVLEFVPQADIIVMVIRLGHTTAASARRTADTVRALSTGSLVLVVVGGETGEADKYYFYAQPEPKEAGMFGRRKAKEIPVGA